MDTFETTFKQQVYELTAQIPKGRVMTYGDVAAYCGSPFASRQVGQIAHFGPSDLPWHRIVNRFGGLASAYTFGGLDGHRAALEADGLIINDEYKVVGFETKRWNPGQEQINLL
jgi:methylated-DNA-protein-cysteine methyltransferase-like protein